MFKHYLASSLRNFRRHKIVTIVQLIGLTVGFACFIIGFGVVRYWSMSDRQYLGSERTYAVTQDIAYKGTPRRGAGANVSYHVAKYLRLDIPQLSVVARAVNWSRLPVAAGGREFSLSVAGADPDFLRIFQLPKQKLALDALRAPRSAVLTTDAAKRLFGSADAVGRTLRLNGRYDLSVTGIFDPPQPSHLGKDGYIDFEVLLSWDVIDAMIQASEPAISNPGNEIWFATCCTTYVQLPADGSFTVAQLRQRLQELVKRRVPPSQQAFAAIDLDVTPIDAVQTTELQRVLFANSGVDVSFNEALLLLATVVLGIACLNHANLAGAQALQQSGQIGMRRILGARRWVLAAYSIFECALISAAAAVLALLIIGMVVLGSAGDVIVVAGNPGLWMGLIAAYATVVVVGSLYPAIIALRMRPRIVLSAVRGRAAAGWLSKALVAAQFIAASVLVSFIIVIQKQSSELKRLGLQSSTAQVVVVANDLAGSGVAFDALKTQLLKIPQVEAVSASGILPWELRVMRNPLSRSAQPGSKIVNAYGDTVWYDFFQTQGIKLMAGRLFGAEYDDVSMSMNAQPARPNSIVIDVEASEQLGFSSPQAAVNQLLYVSNPFAATPQGLRIVGVVESKPLHLVGSGATGSTYNLSTAGIRHPLIRVRGDTAAALAAIDRTWNQFAPQTPIQRQFADELFERNYRIFRSIDRTFGVLTLLALAVACLGLLAMAMHVIRQRMHEIGVRKTLGASAGRVLTMLMLDFSRPVIFANLLAIPVAVSIANIYLSVFIHRSALTATPFAVSLLATLLCAWASIGIQAARASRIRPAMVLRHE